jgi:protein-S-isoprenylcysteine O-methyltransferase Ste14
MGSTMDARATSGVRFPPPLYYVIPLVLSVATELLFPAQQLIPPLAAAMIGACLIALGVAFASSALVTMRRAGTSPVPLTPTAALVTDGPYRFTRNPMYLALTLGYVGVAIWMQAVWAFVYLPIILLAIRRVVIDREERYLTEKFGETYVSYCRRVRRWI